MPGLKKALLIGINYLESPENKLAGCINDVQNIRAQVLKYNPTFNDFRILTDTSPNVNLKPTRKNILAMIEWLLKDLKAGDSVYFHYSGHGGLVKDKNGDEKSGFDSCIYPCNGSVIEQITDDELRTALVDKVPAGCKCFAVLDACHSGLGMDLRYVFQSPKPGRILMEQNNKYKKSTGSVLFLSGCRDNQTSADTVNKQNVPSGALTNALINVWNTYGQTIKFKHLLWDVRQELQKGGYSQIPQLSTSLPININEVFKI